MRVASLIVGTAVAVISLAALRAAAQQPPVGTVAERQKSPLVVAGQFDWFFGGSQRDRPPKSGQASLPQPGSSGDDDDDDDRPRRPQPSRSSGGVYRTLCVRLCDGFPVPLSFATTKDHLSTDARRCEQQCPTRSRLFTYRNPGQSPEDMVDLEGKPYRDLPTAFRYQSTYVADCTCHGNAWDAEALARHEAYAHAPQPNDKAVKSVEQSRAAQPQRPARQSSWGYRDRSAREDDD
jgi:Protein of unknown function (DUF2865)